ncbi:unknown [Clostridium sp. CAG:169]|nr:unknown [Clostridium sp. CAG:169]
MRRVTESLVLLSMVPMMEAAVSSLPSAAVTTAEVLCICSIRLIASVLSTAQQSTRPSLESVLTIFPIDFSSFFH